MRKPVSALAAAALVLGLLGVCTIPIPFVPSFCVGGVGMVFAALALRSWKQESWQNRLMALTGLGLGLLPWAGWALVIGAALSAWWGGQK